jgi:signal transduction histidine kinase
VVGAVAAAIAIVGLKRIRTLNENLTQTVDFLSTNVKLASLIKQDLIAVTRAEQNLVSAQSEDTRERFTAVVDELLARMDGRLKALHTLVKDEDRRLLDEFSTKWAKWRKNHEDVLGIMVMSSDDQARQISVGEAREAVERLEEALDAITQQLEGELAVAEQAEDFRTSTDITQSLGLVASVSRAVLEMQRTEKDLILANKQDELHRYEEALDLLREELDTRITRLQQAVQENASSAMADVKSAHEQYVDANNQIRNIAGEESNFWGYHFAYEVGAPIAIECEMILNGLVDSFEDQMQSYRRSSEQAYATARNTLLGISIFGILVGVAISFTTGNRIARRLSVLNQYAQSIHMTGDLWKPAPQLGSDEVGLLAESFEQMRQSLYEHTVRLGKHTARLAELTQTLESKNQEMEQFVYTVSHDLKSPLVSCKGLLGLLQEDVADRNYEAIVDSTKRLDEATDQLNQIIDDLLMLSRIGKKSLDLVNVDVGSLVGGLIESLAGRINDKGATIQVEGNIPPVVADESDMRRIFENLLTNALKYGCNPENAIVSVGGNADGREVLYYVKDNGSGIDPKYHERIFRLFQRLETGQPGTGLGLASVSKMLSMYGGRVWVESEQNQGATFWVAFPQPPRTASS